MKLTYISPAAREILDRLPARDAAKFTADVEPLSAAEPLRAAEKLRIYLKHRPRVFASAFEANEAEHRELELMNAANKEFWGA